jgi:hypothetical protein
VRSHRAASLSAEPSFLAMRRSLLAVTAFALAFAGVGCPGVRSAVNASPGLRWWLFSNFGASKICPEMLKRGVPLKLPQLGNASVGRFFPNQCFVQVDDVHKAIVMSASGTGYVGLPITRRVGFYVGMTVEYLPDFRLESDSTYVWGRFSRFIAAPDLRIVGVENPVVNLATRTPAGDVATVIANGLVASEIGRGFTVVRQDDGDDFTLGHLEPPQKPPRQFKSGEDHVVLASDLTQVQGQSRDYLGPIEIASRNTALFLRAKVDGAPLAYAIVERSVGETWRRAYEGALPMAGPPGSLMGRGTLGIGETSLRFPLEPGTYYVVVENQAAAPFAPLGVPLPVPEQPAYLSYSLEVGDR